MSSYIFSEHLTSRAVQNLVTRSPSLSLSDNVDSDAMSFSEDDYVSYMYVRPERSPSPDTVLSFSPSISLSPSSSPVPLSLSEPLPISSSSFRETSPSFSLPPAPPSPSPPLALSLSPAYLYPHPQPHLQPEPQAHSQAWQLAKAPESPLFPPVVSNAVNNSSAPLHEQSTTSQQSEYVLESKNLIQSSIFTSIPSYQSSANIDNNSCDNGVDQNTDHSPFKKRFKTRTYRYDANVNQFELLSANMLKQIGVQQPISSIPGYNIILVPGCISLSTIQIGSTDGKIRRTKEKDDYERPVRPVNAFIRYRTDYIPRLKLEYPNANQCVLTRMVADFWRNEKPEVKNKYMSRYKKEYAIYRKQFNLWTSRNKSEKIGQPSRSWKMDISSISNPPTM